MKALMTAATLALMAMPAYADRAAVSKPSESTVCVARGCYTPPPPAPVICWRCKK